MHTYNDRPCSHCGDLNGCHIPGKVKRYNMKCLIGEGQAQIWDGNKIPKYGQASPEIVCLCGSTRFMDTFIEVQRQETMEGNIVLSVGLFGHAEGIDMSGPFKAMLDELHKRKIDLADRVLILNVNGYIGDSTRGEVEYAQSKGKRITYLIPLEKCSAESE